MSGAMTPPPPAGGMMAGAGADPGAAPDAGGDDTDDNVVVTITKAGDGSYMVYAGDEPEPEEAGEDMSADDADAMGPGGGGPAGGAPPAQGQPAPSIGAALKIAMDILQSDASSAGAPGSADDQLSAGFGASKSPTPAGMGA